MSWVTGAAALLLAQDQRPPNAPEYGGSSPIGLVVILLLFVAVFFLIRSMNKHLRKVPPSFDPPERGPDTEPDIGSSEREGPAG